MNRHISGTLTLLLTLFAGTTVGTESVDGFLIDVIPAFAPQGTISPSWNGYVVNAITGIDAGGVDVGDRTASADAYERISRPISPLEMIYTPFHSWRAAAAPSETFAELGIPFIDEFGNRIHFGLHIETDGSKDFALNDLSWKLDSNDDTQFFDQEGSFAGAIYSDTRIGINFGADGKRGGGDDTILDSGEAGTDRIHELIYVGVGDGFLSSEPDAVDDQDDIDKTLRSLSPTCVDCTINLSGIYTLATGGNPVIGTATVEIEFSPGFGGDFDHDGQIDCDDLDLLTQQVDSGANDILFDMDANGLVEFEDIRIVVKDIKKTFFGDANCDNEFNSTDLIDVFVKGEYENGIPNDSVWSDGDWNGDGEFGTSDLILAFQDGGYEQGPHAMAVPEPHAVVLLICGVLAIFARPVNSPRRP